MSSGLKKRLAGGETLLGCFLNLGSATTAEIVGLAGYDWALIDLEHGAGDERDALAQLHALSGTPTAALVRVESEARQRANRVLDFGAHGVMFPRVDTVEQARAAVAAMRYGPSGVRGVALSHRACAYSAEFRTYIERDAPDLLTVVQIESVQAVENADAIAAVDGTDVLFVGPTDLSYSMGILRQFESDTFVAAVRHVAECARKHGKHAGLLMPNASEYEHYWRMGYRFIACGADSTLLNSAARAVTAQLSDLRSRLST